MALTGRIAYVRSSPPINLQTIDVFAAFIAGLVAAVLLGSAVPTYRAR